MTKEELLKIVPRARHWPLAHPIPTVYFLIDDEEIVYVGKTYHLNARLRQHQQDKYRQFDSVVIYELSCYSTRQELDQMEREMIKLCQPRMNGCGRVWQLKRGRR